MTRRNGGLVCGLLEEGGVLCWGPSERGASGPVGMGNVGQLVANATQVCALVEGGKLYCTDGAEWTAEPGLPTDLASVVLCGNSGCGVAGDGSVACWGEESLAAVPLGLMIRR